MRASHAALPVAVSLNNSGLKEDFLKFGHFQSDIPRIGDEIAVAVSLQ